MPKLKGGRLSAHPIAKLNDFLSGTLWGTSNDRRRKLLADSIWSATFKVSGTGLSFAISLLLARILDTDDYGQYYVMMSVLSLIGIAANLGMPVVVTREIAASLARRDHASIRGIIRFGFGVSAMATTCTIAFAFLVYPSAEGTSQPQPILLGCATILVLGTFMGMTGSIQRGFHLIVRSQIPEFLRGSFFVLTLGFVWWSFPQPIDINYAIWLQAIAGCGAAVAALIFLYHRPRISSSTISVRAKPWLAAGLPLMLLAGLSTLNSNADILMLGALAGSQSAGIYHAATRGATFLSFFLAAAILPLGPVVAQLNAQGNKQGLQRLLTSVTISVFLASLPLGIFFLLWGDIFLQLFGIPFLQAHGALVILSLGQLFNIAAGPVQIILIMTGHEKVTIYGVGGGTLVNILLNAILIPKYGINGAAAATAISIVVWNSWLVYEVRNRTALHPTIFSSLYHRTFGNENT